MATSQAPWSYADSGSEIIQGLSEERFKPYLTHAGYDRDYAFALYLYNARMAKAFLFPLHVLEVTLRNAVHHLLTQSFSFNWCENPAFRKILSHQSLSALDKAIARAGTTAAPDIVATLTFDFWSNLFRPEYDRSLWQTRMRALLPFITRKRSEFQPVIRDLNRFRNRVAHHEPIYQLNVSQMHSKVLETLSWISPAISDWVKHFSTVNSCLRTYPVSNGKYSPVVSEVADRDFCIVNLSTPLSMALNKRFIICLDDKGKENSVIEMQHIALLLLSLREGDDLMINLSELTVASVVMHCHSTANLVLCSPTENLALASRKLTGKKRYLLARDEQGFCGVIARPHRKY